MTNLKVSAKDMRLYKCKIVDLKKSSIEFPDIKKYLKIKAQWAHTASRLNIQKENLLNIRQI